MMRIPITVLQKSLATLPDEFNIACRLCGYFKPGTLETPDTLELEQAIHVWAFITLVRWGLSESKRLVAATAITQLCGVAATEVEKTLKGEKGNLVVFRLVDNRYLLLGTLTEAGYSLKEAQVMDIATGQMIEDLSKLPVPITLSELWLTSIGLTLVLDFVESQKTAEDVTPVIAQTEVSSEPLHTAQ